MIVSGTELALWALWTAMSAGLGAAFVPRATDTVLKRSFARSRQWWLEVLENSESSVPYQELCDISAKEHAFAFEGTWQHRVLCAALVGALAGTCALFSSSWVTRAILLIGILALVCGVLSDIQARVIPVECCIVLALAGVAFQTILCGWSGLLFGMLAALFVAIFCWATNCLLSRQESCAIGQGDMRLMVALSLMSGEAALSGAFVSYLLAALVSLVGLCTKRLKLRSGVPMAPFLALWFVVGAGVCLCK